MGGRKISQINRTSTTSGAAVQTFNLQIMIVECSALSSEHYVSTFSGSGSGGSARSTPGPQDSAAPSVISGSDGSELEFEVRGPSNQGLRPIVIDGNNVAMTHGNKETFSSQVKSVFQDV